MLTQRTTSGQWRKVTYIYNVVFLFTCTLKLENATVPIRATFENEIKYFLLQHIHLAFIVKSYRADQSPGLNVSVMDYVPYCHSHKMCHIMFTLHGHDLNVKSVTEEEAAKPVTTVQDCVST